MAAIPALNPLKIPTTTNGETFEGFKRGYDHDHDHDQPLSPMARLFHEPGSNVYIVGIIGLKTKIKPDIFKHNLVHTLLRNPRFSSLQGKDKETGSMKWIPTHVNIDDHVIIAKLDPNMESSEKFVEDFISNLSRSPIESTKPLWDLHILDIKTSETEGTCVFRFHHSLGDGMSLMNLLLACASKASDPEAMLPGNTKKSGATKVSSLWSRLSVLWNSFVALVMFVSTALFLEDTKTPMKGSIGERDTEYTNIPENIRLRSTLFFNLRPTTEIEDVTDTSKHGTWGNKIGYALYSFKIGLKKDPLDYVRDAKAVMDRKKASLEPLFTYFFVNLILKLFGIKVAGKLNYKVFYNTTLWFSNVPGPQEKIWLFGHEVAYIAPSCYGQPNALMIHVVSYMDKLTFVLSADEETIPNPHQLSHDLQESLRIIKASLY
ncbi:hypothetical protein Ccrd_025939 [Cynara cardunculus var. scolymus]|uniref:Uncharacterized protein n=1 Tax=Cynara cardunculus var. scolymus TaxID=59895 RepID=A0A118JS90_CYNCS|nr:hypothetical protein Ccrd_025939 [Cynara cardunculus var. scolymus]